MHTKQVMLPSQKTVTIRRPGFAAGSRIGDGIPLQVMRLGISQDTPSEEAEQKLRDLQDGDLEQCLAWVRQNRINAVCACLHEPKVTPETLDEQFDIYDFMALEKEIAKHKEEVEQRLAPLLRSSKTNSGPSRSTSSPVSSDSDPAN